MVNEYALPTTQGLKSGDQNEDVAYLKNFLVQMGFMRENPAEEREIFDDSTRKSLIDYQDSVSISPTGILDTQTIRRIWLRSCNYMEDVDDESVSGFVTWTKTGWPKNSTLTWNVRSDILGYTSDVISSAFEQWRSIAQVPLNFVRTNQAANADIVFDFGNLKSAAGNAWHPYMAAYTTHKNVGNQVVMNVTFEKSMPWLRTSKPAPIVKAYDINANALHEIGHVCLLNHSLDQSALMYSNVDNGKGIANDDVLGIKSLYKL
jgi:predicted Zn-dependent protease